MLGRFRELKIQILTSFSMQFTILQFEIHLYSESPKWKQRLQLDSLFRTLKSGGFIYFGYYFLKYKITDIFKACLGVQ